MPSLSVAAWTSPKATPSVELAKDFSLSDESESTTHYSVIDGNGLAVSTTTTLENSFGARGVAPRAFYFHDPDGNVFEARYYAD